MWDGMEDEQHNIQGLIDGMRNGTIILSAHFPVAEEPIQIRQMLIIRAINGIGNQVKRTQICL